MVPDQYTRQGLEGVPALTLFNPWALAIARYGKDPENRPWPPPPRVTRLLVHAGKAWDPAGLPFLRGIGHPDALAHVAPSAIVAVVDVVGVCGKAIDTDRPCGCPPRWARPGQYHWRLANPVALPAPVSCRGRQRLWRPDPATLRGVAASLALLAWEPLVCRGRRATGDGRPVGDPHGVTCRPGPGETPAALELRARMDGWKIGPRPADGSAPDAMCPSCAQPSPEERDLFASLRRSPR